MRFFSRVDAGIGTSTARCLFSYIKDKCVLLLDDLLTTGEGFIQTRRKLIEHGAKFVIGLFLAKTIAFEDEQE